ncbi:SPRY domain-containing protein [Marinobacter sp.]|uniref:DUF7483 domain-containing protein n=1 Tax=Marinobacter sp. TaxID=50741 RepID=UPI000C929C96|nr:SPRY domain-containing protein [Marinobacter sp.]MAK52173.1 hypothetical protein [Marinobacter sp.]
MAEPTIKNGEEHFYPIIYEGTGGGQRIGTFVPFTDNATIANSCMFDAASNVSLTRTPSGASNRKTFTVSVWVKRCVLTDASGNNTYGQRIFNAGASGSAFFDIKWSGSGDTEGANRLHIREYSSSAEQIEYWTNRTFEDTSKWYHILLQVDTTQSTSTDRIKLYVDGDQITSWYRSNAPSQDFDTLVNSTVLHNIGRFTGATSNNLSGYLTEFNLVDGSIVAPSTFGLTDTSTGRWIPKSLTGISYGSNGFRLQFGSPSALGDDTSGNENDFSVSNLVAGDQTTDSPTQNFATFDPLDSGNNAGATPGTAVLAEGNLRVTAPSNPSNWDQYRTSKPLLSGKYYVEVTLTSLNTATYFGVISKNQNIKGGGWYSDQKTGWTYDSTNGKTENSNNGYISYGGARSQGDVVGIAVDLDNGKLWFSENGTYPNSGNPATGANPAYSNLQIAVEDGGLCFTEARGYSGHNDWNFGQRSYTHSAPSGFSTVQQGNMPETAKGVSGLVWTKNRDATDNHQLYDSSRGVKKDLHPNTTDQEGTTTDGLQKFLKGGQQIEDDVSINTSGESYVSWNWVCNGGTTETNNDGETTVTLQKNTTAGFSMGTFTSKVAEQTCGHGLGVKPNFILLKKLDGSQNWMAYHSALSSSDAYYLHLNNTDTTQTGSDFGNDVPTSTVFHTNVTGTAGSSYCFWAWRSVEGYSKFGLYEGNNNADGTFVNTGFKPAFVMIKSIDGSSSSYPWAIYDSKRSPINPVSLFLSANDSVVENTLDRIDFLSNGFKCRQSYSYSNAGETYVYVAFAEHGFVGDGTNPVTAR